MRNYDEPIEVCLRTDPSGAAVSGASAPEAAGTEAETSGTEAEPESFRWRGRTYVVHGVVDSWVRSRPWWRYAMDPPSGRAPEVTALLADLQEVVWRVEAARAGGSSGLRVCGVYDLVRVGADRWRLLTVLD